MQIFFKKSELHSLQMFVALS